MAVILCVGECGVMVKGQRKGRRLAWGCIDYLPSAPTTLTLFLYIIDSDL